MPVNKYGNAIPLKTKTESGQENDIVKFFYKSSSDTGNGVVFIMEEDTTIVETDQCNTLIYMKKMILER